MIVRITVALLLIQLLVALLIGHGISLVWPALPLWISLSAGFAVVVGVRALIAANNFFLASRFPGDPPGERLAWRQARQLYLRELRATLTSSSWSMPFRRISATPAILEQGLPVLLIHGYGCNSGYWWHFSRHLHRAGISHHAVDLEPVLGDIDDYVPQIATAIDALCSATRQSQVIIVAHSMGGLVARAWVREHGLQQVARLITLGTPHHGTGLAQFGLGKNARQMRRERGTGQAGCNAWLAALRASEPALQSHLISIYSRHDNIVAPRTSCEVPGAKNLVFSGVGHVALAFDAAVTACVLEQIGEARKSLQAPGTDAAGRPPA